MNLTEEVNGSKSKYFFIFRESGVTEFHEIEILDDDSIEFYAEMNEISYRRYLKKFEFEMFEVNYKKN